MHEDALLSGNFRGAARRFRTLRKAECDAALVTLSRAVEAHRSVRWTPAAPEGYIATVECNPLAQPVEPGIRVFPWYRVTDADQRGEFRRLFQFGQVYPAQGRIIFVVEAGKHDMAVSGAGRGGGAEHLSGARNFSDGVVGDQHHVRHAAGRGQLSAVRESDGLLRQGAEVHPGLADAILRVVALEHDGVAAGHRRGPGEHVEHCRRIEAGDREELEAGHGAELAGAGDQSAERIGVDARGPRPGLARPSGRSYRNPHRLVISAGGDSVRRHVDAREGRGLDEGGQQRVAGWVMRIVRLGNRCLSVEDSNDGAVGHSHVAGVDAVDGLVISATAGCIDDGFAATTATSFTSLAPGPDDHQPVHVHRGLVVAVELLGRGSVASDRCCSPPCSS